MANRFGGDDGVRKTALLRACATSALVEPEALLAYHDVLLFLIAYPESAALRALAQRELTRVAQAAKRIDAEGPARVRAKLRASGLAWSEITIAFSLPIAQWLVARYPRCAEIDSFGDGGALLAPLLAHALPRAEFALTEDEESPEALIEAAGGGFHGSRLAWLVDRFGCLPCDAGLREMLYESTQPFLVLRPRDSTLARTFVRGLPSRVHYHRGPLLRAIDAPAILAQPLPPPRDCAASERAHLVDAGRAVLAMLGRETDPITHADAARTRHYELGRGVSIALYSAHPQRRNPLDSHIGYLLFKNAVPIGYGGGWPFLGTCKIGINIFAAFRGGESAFLMASVLRTYAQLFAVERFVVEPYQFGGGNREGLESGAFWFYYRLGFRPVNPRLRDIAQDEFARMGREAGYRTPLSTLRRFTHSDLECVVVPGALPACDPAALSEATTAWIAARFAGCRAQAEDAAVKRVAAALGLRGAARWNGDERSALRALAPILAQIPDLPAWPARDKRRLARLVRAKGGDEYRYFALMAGFARLRSGLDAIAARAAT